MASSQIQQGIMITGFEQRRCAVAGHEMAYYQAGLGVPVLLVHGITTYSFIWRRIAPALASHYDVIAVDLLGCGASDMPLDISYALKDHADYLAEFTAALDLPRFHLVGHDLGGGISQILAVRHPERLLDLSLLNPVGYDYWPVQPITAMRTPIMRQVMMAALDRRTMTHLVRRGVHRRERVTPELMDAFMAPLGHQAGRKAFFHFARCLDNGDLMEIEAELRELELPVLILRGEDDAYLSGEIARRLQAEIRDSRLVAIAGAGHFMQEDVPERIVDELLAFCGESHA